MAHPNARVWPYTGKVVLFTTFYEYRAYAPYTKALVFTCGLLERLGIKWDYWQRAGDFDVDNAINCTLTKFMQDEEATDFLMIDSDEHWKPEDVVRLLTHPEEIVAGAYRMKHNWSHYVVVPKEVNGTPVGKILPDGTALVEAERLPAGFLRLKKSAVRKFHDAYPELRYNEPEGEVTAFFERFRVNGSRHSEDFGFSRRWREIGGQLWIDPMIKIDHYGLTEYPGDYDAYLKGRKQRERDEAAFKEVERMAEAIKNRSAA